MRPGSLQWFLEKKKDIIEGLQKGFVVFSLSSVRQALFLKILIQVRFTSYSHAEIKIIKKPETPRSDLVTIGHCYPCRGHMTPPSVARFSMVFSCSIHLLCEGEDAISFSATLRTHSPEVDGQEFVTAMTTRVLHANMFGQWYHLKKNSELQWLNIAEVGLDSLLILKKSTF